MITVCTAHRGLHTRHLLESAHTITQKHKHTHSAARQSTVRAHATRRGRPPSSSQHQRRDLDGRYGSWRDNNFKFNSRAASMAIEPRRGYSTSKVLLHATPLPRTPSRLLGWPSHRSGRTLTMASTSTAMPSGSVLVPIAERAWYPRSPKTCIHTYITYICIYSYCVPARVLVCVCVCVCVCLCVCVSVCVSVYATCHAHVYR